MKKTILTLWIAGLILLSQAHAKEVAFSTENLPKNDFTLKGSVQDNLEFESDIIEFKRNSEEDYTLKNFELESSKSLKLNEIKLSNLDELVIKDRKKVVDTKERLRKATTFLLLGSLSVSSSVERSIGANRADGRLASNFKNPIKSLKEGYKADDNEFLINYVGHPLEFFLLTNYFKASGASNKEAFLIAQFTNFTWEFICEGNYVAPSPKDLVTDTIGSLAGIYVYNKFLGKHADFTYNKLNQLGEKYEMNIEPDIKYNSRTRGMVLAAKFKKKI